jgi:hypothetical protein
MGRNELPLDPHHVGVPSGVSKMIFKPRVRWTQTVHLSCVEINTITKLTKRSFHLTDVNEDTTVGCPQKYFQAYGTFGANRAPILCRDKHYHQTDPK